MALRPASIDIEVSSAIPIVAFTATNDQFDLLSGASEMNGATNSSGTGNEQDQSSLMVLEPFHIAADDRELNGHGPVRSPMKPADYAPTAASGSRGFVVGLALSTVLQMLQLECATCVLVVQAGERTASIAIDTGEIIDASYGALKGEEAVFEVLQWQDIQVEFRDPLPVERRIIVPLPQLLMESVRRLDEGTTQLLSERVLFEGERHPTDTVEAVSSDHPLDLEQLNDLTRQEGVLALAVINAQAGYPWMTDGRALQLRQEGIQTVSENVLANLTVQQKMAESEMVDDILVTTTDHYHFVRMLDDAVPHFHYLILDRQRANVAMARRSLQEIDEGLVV